MRLLVANYDYPRPAAAGANRWVVMSKYLRRLGHDVTVVTGSGPGVPPGGDDGIVRTRDPNTSVWLRRALRRPLPAEVQDEPRNETATHRPSFLLTKVVVPDTYLLSWHPWAKASVRRLLGSRRIDCLITSGPPHSTHLLGLVGRRRGAAWIADFRDGWMFEPPHEMFPTAAQRALNRRLERFVVTRADRVVAVTKPIAEDFHSRLGVEAELISNGWDPEVTQSITATSELIDPTKFTFVHTGIVSGEWGRNPRPLLDAVAALLAADPALAGRIEVLFVGMATAEDLDLLRDERLRGCVRYCPPVERDKAFAVQRAAGALLLLTSDRVSEATGKLFEYLGAGRPIIALAEANEAARIVAETGTGVCVPLRDVGAIAAALRSAVDGELERSYAPRGLARYTYPHPAEQMASLVAQVAGVRSSLP
jgi:glycosyltransferase involved in cell wall biosynthesis